jgi:hypothetical protein
MDDGRAAKTQKPVDLNKHIRRPPGVYRPALRKWNNNDIKSATP